MRERSGSVISGICRHWLRLLLCAILSLQGGLAVADTDDCSARSFSAVGHSDAPFEGDPGPATLESETAESLEDFFSALAALSAGRDYPAALRRFCPFHDSLHQSQARKGHLTRAPPLL